MGEGVGRIIAGETRRHTFIELRGVDECADEITLLVLSLTLIELLQNALLITTGRQLRHAYSVLDGGVLSQSIYMIITISPIRTDTASTCSHFIPKIITDFRKYR